ncbi:hypothetical protein O3M35_000200 [Rhynocoris fuscipes]|uniref:1-acyl-sn-glycerol-3-phosphate acyltransferase n=1 Tax=Rhynocoris fuscipes TaxID=488301 RepID=A0AAW1DMW4_9HEMI
MDSIFYFSSWTYYLIEALITSILVILLSANRTVSYYFRYSVYVLGVPLVSLMLIPVFLLRPKNIVNLKIAAVVLKNMTKIIGIEWKLINGEILAKERGAIVVANHQSVLDILGLWNIWEVMDRCTVVSKKTLFYVPFFGQAAWLAGLIFIDRDRPKQAYEIIKQQSALIHEQKTKIWFYPEGTRNKKAETLLPFKKGAFRMAIECKAPIIPVIYSPYYFIDGEKKIFENGKMTISVLEPIQVHNYTMANIDELITRTYDIMNTEYNRLKTAVCKHNLK